MWTLEGMRTLAPIRVLAVAALAAGLALAGTTAALAAGRDNGGGIPMPPTATTDTTTTAATTTTTTPAPPVVDPLHGCTSVPGYERLCPTVSLVTPPAVIKRGKTVTFRGRVADPSKSFIYGITLLAGGTNGRIVADSTLVTPAYGVSRAAARAVVYTTLTWKAKTPGSYTVCMVGVDGGEQSADAFDCHQFVVR